MTVIAVFVALAAMMAAPSPYEGVTEPIRQVVIGSTVAGRVKEIRSEEGRRVRKGGVIMVLEKDEEELNVSIAKLEAEDSSEILSARQKRQTYERDYAATKKLFETSNSVSEEQLWEKELNFKTADADLQKALAVKAKQKLEYQMSKVQLEKRMLRAPFDGIVVKHHKHIAESVQALEPLVDFVDVRHCRFVSYVLAPLAQRFRKGQVVTLQLDGASAPRLRKGRVSFVAPVVDKSSLLRAVKIVFDNANGSIEPGVTGRILVK